MIKGGTLISAVLLVLVSAASVSCKSWESRHVAQLRARLDADNPHNFWSANEGYEQLITQKRFAFGGVGAAGATSDGEFAFRAVLRSPDSAKLFEDVFSHGTREGQLYALCGFRSNDRKKIKTIAASLINNTDAVTITAGCFSTEESTGKVVQQIIAGNYDWYILKH